MYVTQAQVVVQQPARGLGDLGFQIGPRLSTLKGSVGKVAGNVVKAQKKAVVDAGHTVGKVATNKYVIGLEAAALAATGAGAIPAAALLASQKGVGNLIRPGGNAKKAFTGAYQGAITGVAAAAAPTILRGGAKVLGAGASLVNRAAHGAVSEVESIFGGGKKRSGPKAPGTPSDTHPSTPTDTHEIPPDATDENGSSTEDLLRRILAGGPGTPAYTPPMPYTAPTSSPVPDAPPSEASMDGGLLSKPYTIPIAIAALVLFTRGRSSGSSSRRSSR